MKKKIKNINIGIKLFVLVGLLFVLFVDSSEVIASEINSADASIFTDPDKYLFPEVKIFLEFVDRIIDLIINT